jgi:hypothetical protein
MTMSTALIDDDDDVDAGVDCRAHDGKANAEAAMQPVPNIRLRLNVTSSFIVCSLPA